MIKNPIPNDEWEYIDPLGDTKSMLELGNKKNANGIYKHYFESIGIQHTSVDWNGEDGALKLDLREPQYQRLGQFDMITNIGTTEHVSYQQGVWENIHNCCKVGGVIVSITPYHDGRSWWWHGDWYPTEMFFERFAELNGYDIEKMGIGREIPNQNLCVRLQKNRSARFKMPEPETIVKNVIRPR